jgi:hypothetical protein
MLALDRSLDRRSHEEEYFTRSTLILMNGSCVRLVTVVDMFGSKIVCHRTASKIQLELNATLNNLQVVGWKVVTLATCAGSGRDCIWI